MTVPSPDDSHVVSTRGGIIENRHLLHAAIVTSSGLTYTVGDPHRLTLIRSAAKPAQSVAVLECLAHPSPASTLPVSFALTGSDIALMSASHSSEDSHLAHARDILSRAGNTEADLRCGGHPAISEAVNDAWIRDGVVPEGIHNNCSGKHAGMLAAARALGAGPDAGGEYHLPEHPVQVRVREVVHDLVGPDVRWATDGCNLPAPAMSLSALARMYASFAAADPSAESERERHMAAVFEAMHEHPHRVSGTRRFCADVASIPGAVGKIGADACYAVGVRRGAETLGIAAKIEDGNKEILYAAVAEILVRLGVGSEEERTKVEAWRSGPGVERRNTAGVKIGEISFPFVLREVGSE